MDRPTDTFSSEFRDGFNNPHTSSIWLDVVLYIAGFGILAYTVSWGAAIGVLLCLTAHNLSQIRNQNRVNKQFRFEIESTFVAKNTERNM